MTSSPHSMLRLSRSVITTNKMSDDGERVVIVTDELRLLTSIFCCKDEFQLDGRTSDGTNVEQICRDLILDRKIQDVHLGLNVSCGESTKICLNVTLNCDYPCSIPRISLSSTNLTRKIIDQIQAKLTSYINSDCADSQPIVLKIVYWLQDNVPVIEYGNSNHPGESTKNTQLVEPEKRMVVIIKFDHMRAKNRYIKCISRWVKGLQLNGCLVFLNKEIIGIFEGVEQALNEYLKLLRTTTVDVDSNGKCCKERKMDILCWSRKPHSIKAGFHIENCKSKEEFVNVFNTTGLHDIYDQYIKQ